MKNLRLASFLLGAFIMTQISAQSTLLKNVQVVDVTNGTIKSKQQVLIDGDRIISIGKKALKVTDDTRVVDAEGKYLIPGLWDMHVHLTMVGESGLPLFVANGVTGVRDMGGDFDQLKKWRAMEADGKWSYPVIRTPGAIIEAPKFLGMVNQLLGPEFGKTRIAISKPEEAVAVIDSLKNAGVDFIKIRTAASEEVFYAIAQECRKGNLDFTGHIDSHLGMKKSIDAGIKTIEHTDFLQILDMTQDQKNDIATYLGEKDAWFTPTFMAMQSARLTPIEHTTALLSDSSNSKFEKRKYLDPSLLEMWYIETTLSSFESPMPWDSLNAQFVSFAKLLASNSKLLAGTDVGVRGTMPGWSLHQELELMVEQLEISNLSALQSATIQSAKLFGLEAEMGTVSENKRANLVLLEANPLDDISNTQKIAAVIKDGRYLDKKDLNELLLGVERQVVDLKMTYEPRQYNHLKAVLDQMMASE